MKRLAALLPLLASSGFAQCVMCFRTAAAQNIARQQVMNSGIFVMMLPPFVIFGGFLLLCWRRSQTFADSGPEEDVRGEATPGHSLQPARDKILT
jgi:hypothetical protein